MVNVWGGERLGGERLTIVILQVNPKQKKTLHVEYYKYYKCNMAPNNRFTIRVVGMIIWRLTKID